jgi:hypothetical protein
MLSFQRMKRMFHLRPLVKKGQPLLKTSVSLQQPQVSGAPGWVFLTHDANGVAQAFFTDQRADKNEEISVVMDERVCCDTIFRVVRLSPKIFVIYDILVLNGKLLFETTNYETRRQKVLEILDLFHFPDLCAFIPPTELPVGVHIRGYEQYDSNPGSLGVFVDNIPTE